MKLLAVAKPLGPVDPPVTVCLLSLRQREEAKHLCDPLTSGRDNTRFSRKKNCSERRGTSPKTPLLFRRGTKTSDLRGGRDKKTFGDREGRKFLDAS